jgi:FADH2 O2-dependent halogenase
MRNARRLNEFKVEADYSYNMSSVVGNGWLLLGDAARFVDPIFSSGVNIAMHSAKFACEQVAAGLSIGDVSKAALLPYQSRITSGTAIWYEFIRMYYRLQSLFTIFIAKKDYRVQVLELLQGEVYERSEAPVLDAMKDFIEGIERSEDHLLRPYLDNAIT